MSALLLVLVMVFAGSCGGSDSKKDNYNDQIVGTPPKPKEDPFFFVAMPAEAVPAETSGVIGEDTAPAASAQEPDAQQEEPRDGAFQCFSCVRICPADDVKECPGGEDVICGWGVHAEQPAAESRAVAECNGALELARDMPKWSRIEGDCPAATCR